MPAASIKLVSCIFFLLIVILVKPIPVQAQSDEPTLHKDKKVNLKDTLDGKFDFSRFLIESKGFIPIPFIITEPALGNIGGVLALTFLTPKEPAIPGTYTAPDISAVVGMYTANKSWAAGGGQIGSIPKAGIKYRAMTAYADINLSFYRELMQEEARELEFNIEAFPVSLSVSKSIPNTDVYLGLNYVFAKTKLKPRFTHEIPEWIEQEEFESNTGSFGLFLDLDKRDNFFTANKGTLFHIQWSIDDQWTASDYNYQRWKGWLHWFYPLKKQWISGFRLESEHVVNDPPFYLLPMLNMRGVPTARYQGQTTATVETEQRIDLNLRWSIVAFAGYGWAIFPEDDLAETQSAYNFGAGFRYLVARAFGIRAGIDVARGPEDFGWYIVFGHNWIR